MREANVEWKVSEVVVGNPYEGVRWARARFMMSGRWLWQACDAQGVIKDGVAGDIGESKERAEAWMERSRLLPESIRREGHLLKCASACDCE
jgi:hypothetical protein